MTSCRRPFPRVRMATWPMYGAAAASSGRVRAITSERSTVRCRVIAPIVVVSAVLSTPVSSSIPLRSTSTLGLARRSDISGIRLCPPAITLASSPCSASSSVASCSDPGAKYANGGGFTIRTYRTRHGHAATSSRVATESEVEEPPDRADADRAGGIELALEHTLPRRARGLATARRADGHARGRSERDGEGVGAGNAEAEGFSSGVDRSWTGADHHARQVRSSLAARLPQAGGRRLR